MKKTGILFLLAVLLLSALPVSAETGENRGMDWYCVHVKNHVQPCADAPLSFIERYDGYYLDHRHSGMDDADKVVYLTFDAGYENGNVAKVLDVLKQESVPAAFFVVGSFIRNETDLINRMLREGHIVCNHTLRHKDMSRMNDGDFLAELRKNEELFKEKTGQELSCYYRPPEGRFSERNLICAQKNGYKTIFWSFGYADWDNGKQPSAEKAMKIILDNLHNGEVMLLHPTSATNASILGDVIRQIRAQGFRFGTLAELTDGGLDR